MEACPICRASLRGASICRRCRADLSKLQEVERRGQRLAGVAMLALAEDDLAAAAHWLRRAQMVHATPAVQILARQLVGLRSLAETAEAERADGFEC